MTPTPPRWTMRVHLPSDIADNFHYWVIGVKVGSKTYHVKIHVLPPKQRSGKILMGGGPTVGVNGGPATAAGSSPATGTGAGLPVTTFTNGTVNFGLPASS